MSYQISKSACCAYLLLAMSFLLSGCGARYGFEGHSSYNGKIAASPQYPTVTMTPGEVIHAVTPAKGLMFGGYWLGLYVENPEVARYLPRNGSFVDGTDVEAVAVGRTKAYYVNAVHLFSDTFESENLIGAKWFWIDVVASEPEH
ncbi:hypothetical protein ACWPKS_05525 [Coraliomargarita sp. W4R72]